MCSRLPCVYERCTLLFSLYKNNNNNILNRGYCRWQKTDECKAIRMGWYWIRVNLVSIWFLIERLCTFIHVVYSIPSIFHFSFYKIEPPCITCNTVCDWMQSKCYRLSAISIWIFFLPCAVFFLILWKMTISIECTRQAANVSFAFNSISSLVAVVDVFTGQIYRFHRCHCT